MPDSVTIPFFGGAAGGPPSPRYIRREVLFAFKTEKDGQIEELEALLRKTCNISDEEKIACVLVQIN